MPRRLLAASSVKTNRKSKQLWALGIAFENWTITTYGRPHQRAFVKISNWIDGRFSSTQCLSVRVDLFHQILRYCNLIYSIEKINGFFFHWMMANKQVHGMLKTIRFIRNWPMIHLLFLFISFLFFSFGLNNRIGARYLFTLDVSGEC